MFKMNERTIKSRKEKLSELLKKGTLTEKDKDLVKRYYDLYYVGNEKYKKRNISEITNITVIKRQDRYSTSCFSFYFNEKPQAIAMKYLTGQKEDSILTQVSIEMRRLIENQIEQWANENQKTKKPDDEVDHFNPTFAEIRDEFFKENGGENHIFSIWDKVVKKFKTNEIKKKWEDYHKKKANYKWTNRTINRKRSSNTYLADLDEDQSIKKPKESALPSK